HTSIASDERCGSLPLGDVCFSSALARKLNVFVRLSKNELDILANLQSKPLRIRRGQELTHEGQTNHRAVILQIGWGCSFKTMPDGGRQIIAFPIAGDCVGMHSMLLQPSDHAFPVLTDATISSVEASRLLEIFRESPRLGAAFLWSASRDEA